MTDRKEEPVHDEIVVVLDEEHDGHEETTKPKKAGSDSDTAMQAVPEPVDPRQGSEDLSLPAEEVAIHQEDLEEVDERRVVQEEPTTSKSRLQRRVVAESSGPVVRIDSGAPIELDNFNIWACDKLMRKGISPQELNEQQADVLLLGKNNGLLLWVELALCGLLIAGTFLNVYLTLSMPAKGIPSTEQIGIYHKVEKSQEEIEAFAERVSFLMETWKYQTLRGHPRRVSPFLDPTKKDQWETGFKEATANADTYKERSIFELCNIKYRGVSQEIGHQVWVYYQVYRGRGDQEGMIKFDAVARRMKLLEISEGAVNDENRYGLYITKHIDIPERAYMENEKFRADGNPWDQGLGIKPKKAKPTVKKDL